MKPTKSKQSLSNLTDNEFQIKYSYTLPTIQPSSSSQHRPPSISPVRPKFTDTDEDAIAHPQSPHTPNKGWGWFSKDLSSPSPSKIHNHDSAFQPIKSKSNEEFSKVSTLPVAPPDYILEESKSNQDLWKITAGGRPVQPPAERETFEAMWIENFKKSQVDYSDCKSVQELISPVFSELEHASAKAPSPLFLAAAFTRKIEKKSNGLRGDYVGASQPIALINDLNILSQHAGVSEDIYKHNNSSNNLSISPVLITSTKTSPMPMPMTMTRSLTSSPFNRVTTNETNTDQQQQVVVLEILFKAPNIYGSTVSKSFAKTYTPSGKIRDAAILQSESVSVSISSYRVVKDAKTKKMWAEFLVVFSCGSHKHMIGVWKRYSDFKVLAESLGDDDGWLTCFWGRRGTSKKHAIQFQSSSESEDEEEEEISPSLPNALTSWKLLLNRRPFFRCLDSSYLNIKVFLLERFLHDVLFESKSAMLLCRFVGFVEERGKDDGKKNPARCKSEPRFVR